MHHPFEQRTKEWFEARRGLVTASIAGAVLGLDPNRGPYFAYQEILGNHKTEDRYGGGTNPQNWGIEKEAEARDCFEKETGLPVEICGFHTHPAHPWLGASPDGLVGASGGIEIKCPLKGLPERVPIHHRIQCLLQMEVTQRSVWFYYAWTPEKARLWAIKPSRGTAGLIARLKAWYDRHITPQIPPPRRVPGRAKRRKKECAVEDHPMAHAYPFDPENMDTTGYEEPS